MATSSVPNTFVNGTPIDAGDMNDNFTSVVNFDNNNVLHLDGTLGMTGTNPLDVGGLKVVNQASGSDPTDGATIADLNQAFDVGTVQMFAGPTAEVPLLSLLCDGTAVSRTTYSALFGVIGVAYGAGDAATTFNLPDFRSVFPRGDDTGAAVGDTGGSDDAISVSHGHILDGAVTANTAAHTHTWSDTSSGAGAHSHNIGAGTQLYWVQASQSEGAVAGGSLGRSGAWVDAVDHTHSVSGTTSGASPDNANHGHLDSFSVRDSGASGVNKNIPAYLSINFIIRTGV